MYSESVLQDVHLGLLAPLLVSGLSHTSDLIGFSVATLPRAWWYRVSAETGWLGVSIL